MVRIREGETTEGLIKRFKRDFAKSGVLNDLRKHEYFQSLSEKKREKRKRNARMKQKFAYKEKQY